MQIDEFVLLMFVLFSDRYQTDLAHISTFQQQVNIYHLILRFIFRYITMFQHFNFVKQEFSYAPESEHVTGIPCSFIECKWNWR